MSNRATYTIIENNQESHFYIHHDGYSAGAAGYFYNFFSKGQGSGGLLERFIRSNVQASITTSPDDHADTEYKYVLNSAGLLKQFYRTIDGDWEDVFTGYVWDFVNEFYSFGADESALTYKNQTATDCEVLPVHQELEKVVPQLAYIKEYPRFIDNCIGRAKGAWKSAQLVMCSFDDIPKKSRSEVLFQKSKRIIPMLEYIQTTLSLIAELDDEQREKDLMERVNQFIDWIGETVSV